MLTVSQLNDLRQIDITRVDKSALVDLQTVFVDMDAPIEQRVLLFIEQIKNPYAFRVGDIAVKLAYDSSGKSLKDAVTSYLKSIVR